MVEPLLAALVSMSLEGTVPEEAGGWKAAGPAARYDAETIFDYIDGHGEIYLAYGMRSCTARRFAGPPGEGEILVDVFDMGSPADAYGIFSHAREGEPAGIGEESSFGAGTLAFWKGQAFVSITAERSTERSRSAVQALGRGIASNLGAAGGRPALADRLPRTGLEASSVVYLRHPIILAAHLDLGASNVAGVGPDKPAALGRYRMAGGTAWVLLVAYPTERAAEGARRAFAAAFLGEASLKRREDGWWAAGRLPGAEPHLRVFVVRAPSREVAENLLAEALRPQGGEP